MRPRIRKQSTWPAWVTGRIMASALLVVLIPSVLFAKDIEYQDEEVSVYVSPGEPTQIEFPGIISGGFKKKISAVSLDRKEGDLIIFATESLADTGEAIIVRLTDGRSYSLRVLKASEENARDSQIRIKDDRGALVDPEEEEEAPYKEKQFNYAPANQVSGLMREMVLAMEFGKASIPGYRVSDKHQGEVVINDGTLNATIDRIYIGPGFWGYVINVENLLDQSQRLNPATFRLDGTRAISMTNWELSPRPFNIEEQISGKDKTKIYIITKAKK